MLLITFIMVLIIIPAERKKLERRIQVQYIVRKKITYIYATRKEMWNATLTSRPRGASVSTPNTSEPKKICELQQFSPMQTVTTCLNLQHHTWPALHRLPLAPTCHPRVFTCRCQSRIEGPPTTTITNI